MRLSYSHSITAIQYKYQKEPKNQKNKCELWSWRIMKAILEFQLSCGILLACLEGGDGIKNLSDIWDINTYRKFLESHNIVGKNKFPNAIKNNWNKMNSDIFNLVSMIFVRYLLCLLYYDQQYERINQKPSLSFLLTWEISYKFKWEVASQHWNVKF